jgi:4-hydroxy-3-polyprenylbenzoate decarboxylase
MITHGRVVVGVTGASGAPYAARLVRLLVDADVEVHLAVTPLGRRLFNDEMDITAIDAESLGVSHRAARLVVHRDNDLGSTIASGSLVHDGMVIVPCSSNTLGAIAGGTTTTLVQRAAAVVLKERRRLIIAHRESPLSPIDIMNMDRLTQAGAIIAPLSPGFYMRPESLGDIVDFMVGKLADLLGVPHTLKTRWKTAPAEGDTLPA